MNNQNRGYINPMDQFNSITTNNQQMRQSSTGMNNYNTAFTQNPNLIQTMDYQNKGNLMHNNIGEEVLTEDIVEYVVHLDERDRHELATVVLDRGYLYTLATSTNESRWPKVKGLFKKVITSFTFQI